MRTTEYRILIGKIRLSPSPYPTETICNLTISDFSWYHKNTSDMAWGVYVSTKSMEISLHSDPTTNWSYYSFNEHNPWTPTAR